MTEVHKMQLKIAYNIKKGKYKIKINRIKDGVFDSKKWAREIMWYRRKSGSYLYSSTE